MPIFSSLLVPQLAERLGSMTIDDAFDYLSTEFKGETIFSTSFGKEDQAISHILFSGNYPVSVFTLDTGRLFPETYSVWSATNSRYNTKISSYNPAAAELESFLRLKGPNAFYESVENRKDCCYIRKVAPLKRAIAGNKIWITGLRAEQSSSREHLEMLEWDEGNQLIKFHPLLHWTTEQVNEFIRMHNIPYNSLHDKGFISIGCAPCTRAIAPGEDFRAGRWWWEQSTGKECGLHVPETEIKK